MKPPGKFVLHLFVYLVSVSFSASISASISASVAANEQATDTQNSASQNTAKKYRTLSSNAQSDSELESVNGKGRSLVATAEFSRITVSGNVIVRLAQSKQNRVFVTNRATLGATINIESFDQELYIDGLINAAGRPAVVEVAVSELKEIVVQDGAQLIAQDIAAQNLSLESHGRTEVSLSNVDVGDLVVFANGVGKFSITGKVATQAIELSGDGYYLAHDLVCENAYLHSIGQNQITLWVEQLLDVDIVGSARVAYTGSPWIRQKVSGQGALHLVAR